MDPLFKAQAFGMLLLWIPLLAGFFVGRWVYPKLLRLLPAVLPLARSRSSTFMTLVNVTLFATAMVLTTGMLAAKTLVWLQGLTFLPVTPTANWVRALSWLAAFFCGYHAAPLFGRAALENIDMHEPAPLPALPGPRKQPSSWWVLVMLCFILAAGGGLAAVAIGLQKEGFLRTSDVGDLAELASVQEQLRPLEACGIEYKRWDAKGRNRYPKAVSMQDCDSNTHGILRIEVPQTWLEQGVGFTMQRGSTSEPWEILVDKDAVPFPALKEALETFAPIIAAEYPDKLRQELESEAAYRRNMEEYRRQRDAPKPSAKSSYPE
ncbi:hypothetical protein K8640_11150 [Myxococcus sp. XM-1-1-1]|uniref:hypothetical protein n=1 Tax=Myxococcus sp. XM-1-1-1 TaxID=2874602 RepID=UPI001CBFEFC5|nr:hypothetical protein [Myxococcus sp. XM-1-1-1]MBZ4408771.1 hypothetical protein [Myxococcus sp. XM-1-1-1]